MPDVVWPVRSFRMRRDVFRREAGAAVRCVPAGGGFGLPARSEGPKGTLFSEKFELTAS